MKKKILSSLVLAGVLISLFALLPMASDVAHATSTVTVNVGNDTFLNEAYPYLQYGGGPIQVSNYIGDSGRFSCRGLLTFDCSTLPGNLINALLYIKVSYAGYGGDYSRGYNKQIYAYKVTRSWDEATACWAFYTNVIPWNVAGGDYVTSSPTGGVGVTPASIGWMTIDVTDLVHDGIANESGNVDIILLPGGYDQCDVFFSKEASDAANRPYLSVSYTPGSPTGIVLPEGNVTSSSAYAWARCITSGDGNCTATFHYQQSGVAPINITYGAVNNGQNIHVSLTGLTPDNLTWYWVTFSNSYGNYTTTDQIFRTLAGSGPSAPVVLTQPAQNVSDTRASLWGYLSYTGQLTCYVGFDWRVQGDPSWTRHWYSYTNCGWAYLCGTAIPVTIAKQFSCDIIGLTRDTNYEYRAIAKNSLTEPDVVYGNWTLVRTLHFVSTPTPGTGLIPPRVVPPGVSEFLSGIGSNLKLIIAVLVTVGAMFLVGNKSKGKSPGIIVGAVGFAGVLIFTVLGWFPAYVLILIGGAIGLGLLLSLQGAGARH